MSATFRSVKDDLLAKIIDGVWKPGGLMPNEAALAAEYGCARATVNRAMRELAEDGIIERKRKAGTRVRDVPVRQARFSIPIVREEVEAQGADYHYALLNRSKGVAPDWLCRRLRLAAGQQVWHLTCLHSADGRPYQFEDRWINPAATPGVDQADFTHSSPNEWLIAVVPFTDAEISLSAVQADEALAEHLDCRRGDALFRTERTTWWQDQAVTLVNLTYRHGHQMTTRY